MKVPFDETDAPPGYRAVPAPRHRSCADCAFGRAPKCANPYKHGGPLYDSRASKRYRCIYRADGTPAVFARALYGNEED